MNTFGFEILSAALRTWSFIIFTCIGCLVISLIIVKLKVHACKFRKSSLGFQNQIPCYHVDSEAAILYAYTVFILI